MMKGVERRWMGKTCAGLLAGTLLLPSCYYDSRWGESRRIQKTNVQSATPSALRATPEGGEPRSVEKPPSRSARVLRIRAYATPRYAAEVTDWPRQLADLVVDANQVLSPTLAVHLEIAGAQPWRLRGAEDDLSALVDELGGFDPGKDVEWVIGLVGSVPRAESSFQKLGVGQMMGKHIVMRAMNDAREFEAIQRNLPDIDDKERLKLYRARKRHKATAVLLHEIGHTLGVQHELTHTTIMHTSYDHRMESYSDAASAQMRMTLAHRLDPSTQSEQDFAKALLDHMRSTSTNWIPAERDHMIAGLEAALASPREREATKAAPQRPAIDEGAITALRDADRAVFTRAVEAKQAGRLKDALSIARPLFTVYPAEHAVQDLRCQLAMAIGGEWGAVETECKPLLQLTTGASGKRK